MGYLKPNLRRGVARRQKVESLARPLPASVLSWLDAPDTPPAPEVVRYVRLATNSIDAGSGQFLGVFGAAYRLRDSGKMAGSDLQRLRRSLRWFVVHLHAPKHLPPLAVFWFRTDAQPFIQKVWGLVRVLRRHGVRVTSLNSEDPGRVVYRDGYQVAAVPDRFLEVDDWPENTIP